MEKKYILITGASSGIGKAFAEKLASLGKNLIILGRNKDILITIAEGYLKKWDVAIVPVSCDLSKKEQITKLFEEIKNYKIEGVINSAGFGFNKPIIDLDEDEIERMIHVHVFSTVRITQYCLRDMIREKNGFIINVSSIGAFIKVPNNTLYSATKCFINNFTENLMLETAGTKIKIQCLCPGYTKSNFYNHPELKDVRIDKVPRYLWHTPEEVVHKSLKNLKRGRVLYIPGVISKMSVLNKNIISRIMIKEINKLNKTKT